MSETPKPERKASRLLQALDNPNYLGDQPEPVTPFTMAAGLKRAIEDDDEPSLPGTLKEDGPNSSKRRASGLGIHQQNVLSTPGTSANDLNPLLSQLLRGENPDSSSLRARYGAGIVPGIPFHLRYDDESLVSKIDCGGSDQATR
ncbi:hypothetical protein C8Q75DRAFT_37526 [Abortiporus biennis]|nr:hypothetical protein C8Q75DRAFT_37526 [Abortiporus biennis]